MNSDLEQLIQLQGLDLQIRELTRQRDDFPRQTESLEVETAKAEKELQDARNEMDDLRKERRRLEGEVDALRPRLSKYKDQLMAVKTNKEYTAVLHEIEGCNKEILAKEDEVLAIMEKMETLEKTIGQTQQTFSTGREACLKQQAELRRQADGVNTQIEGLLSDRNRLLRGISASSLDLYSRIADARKGVALAEARDQSCQVCHVRLRLQMFNEIRKNEHIVTCDSCNRILYYIQAGP